MQSTAPTVFGTNYLKQRVQDAINLLPLDLREYVLENVSFIGSFNDAWAYALKREDVSGKYLIIVSNELLMQDKSHIIATLVHEIGHAALGHKNSIGNIQTKREIRKQEQDAHHFTRRLINV